MCKYKCRTTELCQFFIDINRNTINFLFHVYIIYIFFFLMLIANKKTTEIQTQHSSDSEVIYLQRVCWLMLMKNYVCQCLFVYVLVGVGKKKTHRNGKWLKRCLLQILVCKWDVKMKFNVAIRSYITYQQQLVLLHNVNAIFIQIMNIL